ncbi:hypothetical protein MMC25_003023 [Agyrium rufum]|nr:hypothetical protein [Agyrium rufum]
MAQLNLQSTYTLNTGYKIPILGFGVYQTPPAETESVCTHALKSGYRHIDSAKLYRNEGGSAAAIKKSSLPRSEIYITSKIPTSGTGRTYDQAKQDIEDTMKVTGLDYIDLYLLHSPYGGREKRLEAWRALVDAQKAGRIRSIGVSNYGVHHLEELKSHIAQIDAKEGKGAGGVISVGQWEMHPWCDRKEIAAWCKENGVVVQAYSPVVQGQRFGEPVLKPMTEKYNKTPAQILLRWSLQKGYVPLPKSVTPSRIEENTKLYDFNLDASEMKSLDTGVYAPVCWDPVKSPL